MSGPRQINIVTIFMFLLVAASIYGIVQYAPIFWKREQLVDLVKEECFGSRRKSGDDIAEAVIDAAQRQLRIALDPEDVVATKFNDRVRVRVFWRPVVQHPLGHTTVHVFKIEKEIIFY